MIQPLGTSKLAVTFAPIVIVWLGFNGGFGIYNLVKYDRTVLKAFSPYFAIEFFVQHKAEAWKMLGGVLLAFTGVEALFADLGAFSMRAIKLSWMCYTYPCLMLAYLGQAAYISKHPGAHTNPFFNSVPPGMLYPGLVAAVLAAIVASEAIITATFQLTSQIMKLSYCPQVKVVHTSSIFYGHMFVPFLNKILMCGAILVTAVYSNTTRLGNAYGVCVMFVTFFDTCMVTLVSLIVWRLSPFLVVVPWLTFACIDGLYLSAALIKVPDGAWFTLTISGILASLFLLWRFGKENQWRAEADDRFSPTSLITKGADGRLELTPRWGGETLASIRGFGIFFDKTGVMTPSVFTLFASKLAAVSDVIVFFHLHPVEAPTVPVDERYTIRRFTAIPGCYRMIITHGFMDEMISPDLAALIYEQVRAFVIREARAVEDDIVSRPAAGDANVDQQSGSPEIEYGTEGQGDGKQDRTEGDRCEYRTMANSSEAPADHGVPEDLAAPAALAIPSTSASLAAGTLKAFSNVVPVYEKALPIELRDASVAAELACLDRAFATKILYVVGKCQMRVRGETKLWRRILLHTFLWIRDNTRAKIANLGLAMDRVVEVGFVKDI